jgi:hypothetical protein
MNNYSTFLKFILGFIILNNIALGDNSNKTLNFFYDQKLNPLIGLSCSSEQECKNKCNNTDSCQKEVKTCLSCIGSKSPYLNDFFNNVGDLTTACRDQDLGSTEAEKLFNNIGLVPIFPISPYNPLGLKDMGLMIKFMSLCPAGTLEPVAIAFTDNSTHAILDIPLVKCGNSLFSLVRMGENCSEKTDQIINFINQKEIKVAEQKKNYLNALSESEKLPIKYDIIQYSKYTEANYISCNEESKSICQQECHSTISCVVPTNNDLTAKGIVNFNKGNFKTCGTEKFSYEILKKYFNSNSAFAFNSLSLEEYYDIPQTTSDFSDLTIINSILSNFKGVFQTNTLQPNGSFFISSLYQTLIQNKMNRFCDQDSNAFIFGHNDIVERVFCKNGINGFFQILARTDEDCEKVMGNLSITNEEVLK